MIDDSLVPVHKPEDPSNADLQKQITELAETINVLTSSVSELTSAWNNAKGITSFIKWCAGLASSVAIVWATLHGDHK